MKFKCALLPLFVAALSGCDISSEDVRSIIEEINKPTDEIEKPAVKPEEPSTPEEPASPPSAFNLVSVVAKDANTLVFTWDGASGGVTFKVCQKEPALTDSCEIKATVSNQNSVDVSGLSVFDVSTSDFFVLAENEIGKTLSSESSVDRAVANSLIEYVKSSNAGASDGFGYSLAMSADGKVLAIGASKEGSSGTGVDGDQLDDSSNDSGAVYVFRKDADNWVQEAYVKASNSGVGDRFGYSVSINADGSVLAVGASREDSGSNGINGNQFDNSASNSGAVYVFRKDADSWAQEAYVKASNSDMFDRFGRSVSLSNDGSVLAVGAYAESGGDAGVNGDQLSNSEYASGAVYVFSNDGMSWAQEAYIKSSDPDADDYFGSSISLSGSGSVLAVGAARESSGAVGINGDHLDNTVTRSGAVYVYRNNGGGWAQEAYIKSSNTEEYDAFGVAVSLSDDGNVLAVGADSEDSSATSINGDQLDNSEYASGAVYVFRGDGSTWAQEAYIKASNAWADDRFGGSVELSGDGAVLAVGADGEDSGATGVSGDQYDETQSASGSVYVFASNGVDWEQREYVKASNAAKDDEFGHSLALSVDGSVLVVGADKEDSGATTVGGDQLDDLQSDAGAVYIYN